ncbi:ATPase [Candidatus Magnetomorum sp. HK-1]|nr:ATPase [Candidatus Magnetomorum sp. HK-1]
MKNRYIEKYIYDDLLAKMVFIGGPRQVGKTTLAQKLGSAFQSYVYLNWDSRRDKQVIIKEMWEPEAELIIFDELHKYDNWKSHIKGIWDTRKHDEKILVTGSSRLDIYRRGGDSLLGRYHYYRLHPFSLAEVEGLFFSADTVTDSAPILSFNHKGKNMESLFQLGGFPEPYLSQSQRVIKRWQNERFERIFREDIRDTENVVNLSKLELLGSLLPGRIASPLSLSSLTEDINVSPATINKWIELLCRNYYIFKVPPYHKRLERALKKESKYYLWDWSEIKDDGPKFENMIASHLMKFCNFYYDVFGIKTRLNYIRDREKREVDFLLLWEDKPWMLVECKVGKPTNMNHIKYFGNKLNVDQKFFVIKSDRFDYLDKNNNIRVIPAEKFLMALI